MPEIRLTDIWIDPLILTCLPGSTKPALRFSPYLLFCIWIHLLDLRTSVSCGILELWGSPGPVLGAGMPGGGGGIPGGGAGIPGKPGGGGGNLDMVARITTGGL